ncbi:hypothetical protein K503DRAFT_786536 [Rhizopogon vinicolor AM-OR11-026]|uniref:SNF2 N-terminal domain-containing protein n=1 Tax=Rhizopogon vinicolor AM-OR11-026 TaxID=1314800 RepID=A0A1B7MLC5_9AGAM|nr:hypothetical protein K503DRAFT_786536 [Rhizopogon vinicolor AM-OR11-026]
MEDIRTINLSLSFDNFRPAINLNTLIALLKPPEERGDDEGVHKHTQEDYDVDDEAEYHAGNKRRHSEYTSTFPMRSKSRRVQVVGGDSELDAENRSSSLENLYEDPAHKQIYPCTWEKGSHNEPNLDPASQSLPVFKSFLEMCYTKSARHDDDNSFVADRAAKKLGWLKKEEDLLSLLSALCPDWSQPKTFDLGWFRVQDYNSRLLALSDESECPRNPHPEEIKEKSERWFFLLPQVAWPDGLSKEEIEDNCLQYPSVHEDLLEALFTFQSLGRAKVETTVQVIALPEGGYDPAEELPFRLHAQFNVSIVVPGLYQPFDARNISQKQVSELEGLPMRLITFFTPTSINQPLSAVEHDERGEAGIPFFYDALRPAPPLPQGVTCDVGWMLQREKKTMSQEVSVVPYDLSQSHLVMLPFWELEVKEIKTTLIITPPALAPQWADEFAAHAPGLKVLVHEGWSKVDMNENDGAMSISLRKDEKGKSKVIDEEDATVIDEEWTSTAKDDGILDWYSYVNTFDVFVVTYNVLRQDLTVARAPSKRPRRADVEYSNLDRPRMMGTSKSEKMVSLIPRLSSFAVSGTPARTQVSDLIRVLRFLRVDDVVDRLSFTLPTR